VTPAQRLVASGVALSGFGVSLVVLLSPVPNNPPVSAETRIESHLAIPPAVARTLRRACYDCHSHETRWPWYSRLPLVSGTVAEDVRTGRADLNFSVWSTDPAVEPTPTQRLTGICQDVSRDIMPPQSYLLLHPSARLTAADVREVCDWTASARRTLK
jgi:hypothetical protein